MKTKIKNKFTAILVAIAMLFAGFFAFGGMKMKTAKADSGTTYTGANIDDIAADFVATVMGGVSTDEGTWIICDDQILNAQGAYETLEATLVERLSPDPMEAVGLTSLEMIGNAGIHIVKDTGNGGFEDISSGCFFYDSSELILAIGDDYEKTVGMGIWQFNQGSYEMFDDLQSYWADPAKDYNYIMPIYVIEREEAILGGDGLVIWVYMENAMSFWLSTDGRPD